MKKGGDSESTIRVGPSKSVLVYSLHSLEYVLGLARFLYFQTFIFLYYYILIFIYIFFIIIIFDKDDDALNNTDFSSSTFGLNDRMMWKKEEN